MFIRSGYWQSYTCCFALGRIIIQTHMHIFLSLGCVIHWVHWEYLTQWTCCVPSLRYSVLLPNKKWISDSVSGIAGYYVWNPGIVRMGPLNNWQLKNKNEFVCTYTTGTEWGFINKTGAQCLLMTSVKSFFVITCPGQVFCTCWTPERVREGQGRRIVHAERKWEKHRVTVSEMKDVLTQAGSSWPPAESGACDEARSKACQC